MSEPSAGYLGSLCSFAVLPGDKCLFTPGSRSGGLGLLLRGALLSGRLLSRKSMQCSPGRVARKGGDIFSLSPRVRAEWLKRYHTVLQVGVGKCERQQLQVDVHVHIPLI